jgi:hypothetical protein
MSGESELAHADVLAPPATQVMALSPAPLLGHVPDGGSAVSLSCETIFLTRLKNGS